MDNGFDLSRNKVAELFTLQIHVPLYCLTDRHDTLATNVTPVSLQIVMIIYQAQCVSCTHSDKETVIKMVQLFVFG